MANCCEEIFCKKLVTIGDLDSMISNAPLDCTNYKSTVTKNYNGCCNNVNASGYSPTYNELTASTSPIEIQNWSGNTYWGKDNDGFSASTPNWNNPSCCSGVKNVPLENIVFKNVKFNNFTLTSPSQSDDNPCATSTTAYFDYELSRCAVTCDGENKGFVSGVTDSKHFTNNNFIDYGEIVSAICVNTSSQADVWTPFIPGMSDITVGNVTVRQQNLFAPTFNSNVSVSGVSCEYASAYTPACDAYVHIMPKFRECPKTDKSYHVSRIGMKRIFEWDSNIKYYCQSYPLRSDAGYITIGKYTSEIIDSNGTSAETITVDNIFGLEVRYCTSSTCNNVVDWNEVSFNTPTIYASEIRYDSYTPDGFICAFNTLDNYVTFSYPQNTETNQKEIEITIQVKIGTCASVSTTCTICQAPPVTEPKGTCCTGVFSLFSSINCNDTDDSIENKTRNINNPLNR